MRHCIAKFAVVVCLLTGAVATAQTKSQDGVWEFVGDEPAFKMFHLDGSGDAAGVRLFPQQLREILAKAPLEGTDGVRPVLSLPVTSGAGDERLIPFAIEESPMVEDRESDGSSYRSYRGRGTENPSIITRFDVTGSGLNGIVLAGNETYFITPVPFEQMKAFLPAESLRNLHLNFPSSRVTAPGDLPQCLVRSGARRKVAERPDARPRAGRGEEPFQQRTYRIAIAATSDYVKFHHDKHPELSALAATLQAIKTTLNFVRAVYEREFGINFVLVSKEEKLIFTDPKKDPYVGKTTPDAMLSENQKVLDETLGDGVYDVGHLFATRGSGKAEVGVVCESGWKGRGLTGLKDATADDYFAIDYVAHELGHQFGAEHTFNGTKGACDGNRVETSAFEPGSGWTIMGYAGICNEQDLAERSKHYFHAASLQQITSAFPSTGTCAKTKSVKNRQPVVAAPSGYVIPGGGTRFTLQAQATDADDAHLIYIWDEYYPASFAPPWTPAPDDEKDREPRPVIASTANSAFDYIPGSKVFRDIPRVPRKLNLRVTARDGRGRYGSGDIVITIAGTEPFVIASPQSSTVWAKNTANELRWLLGKSNEPPVNCARVRVRLSVDDGATLPWELAASTPNTGTMQVSLPAGVPSSSNARIRLDAIDNVFYALSPRFAIADTQPATAAAKSIVPESNLVDPCADPSRRSMADIRSLAIAVEAFATDANRYPTRRTIQRKSFAKYGQGVTKKDSWGRPLQYFLSGSQTYVIVSAGGDGVFHGRSARDYLAEDHSSSSDDIVFSNGVFLRYPSIGSNDDCSQVD